MWFRAFFLFRLWDFPLRDGIAGQQSPHNSSGNTMTSARLPQVGHTRAGARSSTSATACITWIKRINEIANWAVFRF
jgi:hypothetical protein